MTVSLGHFIRHAPSLKFLNIPLTFHTANPRRSNTGRPLDASDSHWRAADFWICQPADLGEAPLPLHNLERVTLSNPRHWDAIFSLLSEVTYLSLPVLPIPLTHGPMRVFMDFTSQYGIHRNRETLWQVATFSIYDTSKSLSKERGSRTSWIFAVSSFGIFRVTSFPKD
jgi:hypothetical protein